MKNCYGYNKQYNPFYRNVFYENSWWRLYDERSTDSYHALFSETQIKFIELIEKFDLKIFYFNCKPASTNKLIINNKEIDLNDPIVKLIKKNQQLDFYFFYENQLCEVFYSFPKIDSEKNYYFDFILVTNNSFKINDIFNHSFKTIKIVSIKEITVNDLTFDYIKNIFESRSIISDTSTSPEDEDYYDLNNCDYDINIYLEDLKKKNLPYIDKEYMNLNSFYFDKNFNQDLYVKGMFKLLCCQIWSMDRKHYIEKNKFGFMSLYEEKYNLMSPFLTNFGEIINCISINLKNNEKIENIIYTFCTLDDNHLQQSIISISFDKKLINNEINFENLEIVDITNNKCE